MFRHHLLIIYRSFLRNKSSFFINLVGLSTGLACVLLIFLWVNDEVGVDKFHEKDSQLYQVMNHYQFPDGIQTRWNTPSLLASEIEQEIPEIESAVTTISRELRPEGVLSNGENINRINALFATDNYFEVFSYELIQGDSKKALVNKNQLVISKELAVKLFGSTEDVIGKSLEWENLYFDGSFQISGVFDLPANSTVQFDVVAHMDKLVGDDEDVAVWSDGYAKTYLVLNEGTNIDHFNDKIADYLKSKHATWEPAQLFVRQYSSKYLHGQYENGVLVGGRIAYVKLFTIIALFILLIACINFMNLSTAQASKKMKEIGVKKTIGASRKALVTQFLSESILMVILSMIAAVGLVVMLLPQFNATTGKLLRLNMDGNLLLTVAAIVLVTGFVAGSYPAFYLSGFKPLAVLKGKRDSSIGELWIRKGLVVFQFALSVIFIVGVLVINQQMEYTQSKNLGYDREHILCFQRPNYDDPQAFLSEIKNISGVVNAGNMNMSFLSGDDAQSGYSWRGRESDEEFLFKAPQIGYDIIETLGMEIVMGRSFSREHNDDVDKIILNETALKMMQLENPIGKLIDKNVGDGNKENRQIIGVVKDFNYGSIHHKVDPLVLRFRSFGLDNMVKMKAGSERGTVKQIEQLFKNFHPAYDFEFTFLDADYQQLYEAESKVAVLSKYFSGLAIIISCLGLFALAAFTAERRTKEIGIRKVLGSSVWGIVNLLSRDFTKMVVTASLIALPISYLIAKNWLEAFAYKIDLQWWFFTLAALITLLIAWLTVAFQTFKAARVNPVECLNDE